MTKQFDLLVEKLELKMVRGNNRKSLRQIPDVARTKEFLKNYRPKTKTSHTIVQVAKKAMSGVWKISKHQVVDIAQKYHFGIPTEERPTRKLGSTGITLYRKGPGKYFLIKRARNVTR